MARIRGNYVSGTVDVALGAADTTLQSAGLADLPAVASPNVAAITLHDGTNHEIVHVTAHTAAATTATIARAQEGTSAQAWAADTTWNHGATAADFVVLIDNGGTVPATTPVGALIFEKGA